MLTAPQGRRRRPKQTVADRSAAATPPLSIVHLSWDPAEKNFVEITDFEWLRESSDLNIMYSCMLPLRWQGCGLRRPQPKAEFLVCRARKPPQLGWGAINIYGRNNWKRCPYPWLAPFWSENFSKTSFWSQIQRGVCPPFPPVFLSLCPP